MFKRRISISTSAISNSKVSSEVVLLTWLIYAILSVPLTAGLGLGNTEAITRGTTVLSSTTPTNNRSSIRVETSFYNCPAMCQCEYSSSSQTLSISCSSIIMSTKRGGNTEVPSINNGGIHLSRGVRILKISQAFLNTKSIVGLGILPPLAKNTLVELQLTQVSIEPKSFFTSSLFMESQQSLRKISIRASSLIGDDSDSITAANFRGDLQPFALLKSMDSLIICDSNPSLATIILQAMPPVVHLRSVNNSLYEIPYETLSLSSHQYSIESLDFSRNHLSLIPNGLLEGLTQLQLLDVSGNRIYHLQEQVFTGLNSLLKLNVSHNQIEYVDAEVFTPLRSIRVVDISYNNVVQFFEPYFANNKELKVLNMENMWIFGTFTSADTALRSLMETEALISSLNRVEKLDISNNGMKSIPETLTHAPNLLQVFMDGNKWECSCQDRWFLDWVTTSRVSVGGNNSTDNMWCFQHKHAGEIVKRPFQQYLKDLTRTCTNSNIIARTPYKFHAVMGKNKKLNCHAQKPSWPRITWITPSKQQITTNENNSFAKDSKFALSSSYYYGNFEESPNRRSEPRISSDGSLHLSNVTASDYGLYLCVASYEDLNITHYVHLGMDVSVFRDVRLMSILVGWIFSFSFLALVLIFQLVNLILRKLGVNCVMMSTTKQTRRVRAFFDSMEQHKTSQLDWLRDNYNMQTKKIKDNCSSQLERIRDSYATQSKNLGEIRDYGTQQLHTLRDQYNDQVRKVSSYSAHQLCKVRENYVFKRNQVCKFSSHQLLRLRETYKWQAQTLNKILENLPRGLNFDTCRGMGTCGRTDSIYLDDMGEDLLHHVQAEVYHMTSNGSIQSADKFEHVSLLIPSEFVHEYKRKDSPQSGDVDEDDEDMCRQEGFSPQPVLSLQDEKRMAKDKNEVATTSKSCNMVEFKSEARESQSGDNISSTDLDASADPETNSTATTCLGSTEISIKDVSDIANSTNIVLPNQPIIIKDNDIIAENHLEIEISTSLLQPADKVT